MKKIFATLILMSTFSFAFAEPAISEKVLKAFRDVFPSIQNAKWQEHESFYQVYFDKDDVKCRIKYDFDGQIISTQRYYGESGVCPFLKAKLAQKYPGKKIFGVTETNSENEMTYEFVLEDDKIWMKVTSDALGSMGITEKFKKAAE